MADIEQQLANLETQVAIHDSEIKTLQGQGAVLPLQLDPTNDLVFEQKFSIHSALGRSGKTSTQSINDSSTTKVVWESNTFINEMTWDSTNNRFVISRAGKYLVSAAIMYTSAAVNGLYEILIYKNGVEYSRTASQSNAAGAIPVTPIITDILSLLQNDYIEINTYHVSGGAKSLGNLASNCFFSIARIN